MKRIFVTGASGFIGFHLCLRLAKLGYAVEGLDNFNDYYDVRLKNERLKLLNEQNITVHKADLTDQDRLKKLILEFKPTHVVNLAAQAGVRYSLVDPDSYVQSNLVGFTHLLEVIKEMPSCKLVYASSSSVYGDNTKIPFYEEDRTDSPKNLYGATKKANELMAYAYHSLYSNPMIGLRFFTVYGPWGRPDMAYYLFSDAILKGEPITVYSGEGIQRDFTYIDDIVDGIVATLDCEVSFEVFNLGNHKPTKLTEFIEILEEALGKKAKKEYFKQAKGDMLITCADISKSQQHLNYRPKTDLKQGLQAFAQWFVPYWDQQNSLQSSSK